MSRTLGYIGSVAAAAAAQKSASTNDITTGSRSRINSPNLHQSAVVYDIISEGPIEGLVNGTSSIYLDTTPVISKTQETDYAQSKFSANVDFDSANLKVTDRAGNIFANLNTSTGLRYITISSGKKTATNSLNLVANSAIIESSTAFFNSNDASLASFPIQKIRIPGVLDSGGDFVASISQYINTSAVRVSAVSPVSANGVTGHIDKVAVISSFSGNTATISNISGYGSNVQDVTATTAVLTTPTINNITQAPIYNFANVAYAFKTGTRSQSWLQTPIDIGSASIIANLNLPIAQTDMSPLINANNQVYGYKAGTGETATAANVTISSTQMNIGNQIPEVDRLKLTFRFGQMFSQKPKSGTEHGAHAEFRIFLQHKPVGAGSFTETLIYGPSDSQITARGTELHYGWRGTVSSSGMVKAQQKNPFIEVFDIDLSRFQPLTDIAVKIQRITPTNARHGDWNHYNDSTLQSIESLLVDKLSYPLTAYGAMIFDSQDFQSIPERGYHVRGMKIKVPTNYFPLNSTYEDGTRVTSASYTRNKTTGVDTGAYVNWDGSFRGDRETYKSGVNFDLVYCNNPAWVFYDLVTNTRYGLGNYIDASDIDKYALYQIARYCDELVPDGQGGYEPRFTSNIWFTEQTEAIKALKDITSVFRGMMYWRNGKITFSQNRKKNAIHTFNKGNVAGGLFEYQSSRNRFRNNTVKVTWNDPDQYYKKVVEVVEDTDNIIKTRNIRSKDVVAFGCTSKQQAIRFGKWHLLTELLEKEVVTFGTGVEGAFLKPGDVVKIQDADRNNVRFGGRVSTGSTTTTIELDGAVDLSNSSTYNIELIFPEGGAFLQQDSATILGTTYKVGDYIPYANNTSGTNTAITSDTLTANAVDDSGNALDLVWSGDSRVEVQRISSYTASNVTVASAFTSAPARNSMWAIVEIDGAGQEVAGSAKEYQIQSIAEDSEKMTYAITAIEYVERKFDLVDKGYDIQTLPDVTRPPKYTENVPYPIDITVVPVKSNTTENASENNEENTGGIDLLVSWQHPNTERTDQDGNSINTMYEHIKAYEVSHNVFTNRFEKHTVDGTQSALRIRNVSPGSYIIRVRLVNTIDNYSKWVERKVSFTAASFGLGSASRINRLPKGGSLSTTMDIDSSNGLVTFAQANYFFLPVGGTATEIKVSSGNTAYTQQAFSSLANNTTGYLVFDYSDTVDPLKAIEIKTDTTAGAPTDDANDKYNFEYVAELGAANDGIAQANGTANVAEFTSNVVGTSTTFLSDYAPGDRFIIEDAGNTRFFANVSYIESNTSMYIDQALPRAYSASNVFVLSYKPDFEKDSILASVANTSGTFSLTNYTNKYKVEAGELGANSVTSVELSANSVGSAQIQANSIDTVALTANALASFTVSANSITAVELAANSIEAVHISANSIGAAAIIANSIGSSEIASNSIGTAAIIANSITNAEIAANSITSASIVANAITNAEIASNAIGTLQIQANSITSAQLTANALASFTVGANEITAVEIASGTITNALMAANSITSVEIAANSIGSAELTIGSVSGTIIASGGVGTTQLATGSVTGIIIANGAVDTNQLAGSAITAAKIADDAVTTAKIIGSAITAAKIAANAVTSGKVATNAVSTAQIVANAITSALLASNSVTNETIQANSIDSVSIATGAVGAIQIATGAVTNAKMAANAIGAAQIIAGSITSSELAANSVGTAQIAANTITNNELSANSVNAAIIAANSITNNELSINSVNAAIIQAGIIDSSHIAANAITSAAIAANSITNNELTANSVNAAIIQAGTIDSSHIGANSITAAAIVANAITNSEISANSITSVSIQTGAVGTNQITSNAITNAKISSGAVDTNEIAANAITNAKIESGAVTNASINASGIDFAKITSVSITSAMIQANSITSAKIAANQIGTSEIAANSITSALIAANQINTAEIVSGSITTALIAANAITAAKIAANQIGTSEIIAGSIDSLQIAANAITNAKISSTDSLTLTVTGGTAGGWTLNATSLSSANIVFDSSNQRIVISDST